MDYDIYTYRLDSNGYVINLGSKGISGNVLLYFTLATKSDLKNKKNCVSASDVVNILKDKYILSMSYLHTLIL
jgi:hypothetical protein